MITPDDFRSDLPEFSDDTAFPVGTIQFWMAVALLMINQTRWGIPGAGGSAPRTEFDIGEEMFIAHYVTMEARAANDVSVGGIPLLANGPVSSRGAGDVSVSYASQLAAEEDAGHWNQTVYGTRFIRLARMYGAGVVQVSGCVSYASGAYGFGFPW